MLATAADGAASNGAAANLAMALAGDFEDVDLA
jgi:hypothetical protein